MIKEAIKTMIKKTDPFQKTANHFLIPYLLFLIPYFFAIFIKSIETAKNNSRNGDDKGGDKDHDKKD